MATDADRWARIEELCQAALDMGESEQLSLLESACGMDQDLRRQVESLLVFRRHAERFIETPAMDIAARVLADEQAASSPDSSRMIGRAISHYQIVEKIASGGMGEVYRAVRADNQFRKEVAIKLVRAGQDSQFVIDRFKHERQVLANLDHPNIARLLDGGTTDDGVPYFVMELIEGQPFTEYCDSRKLAITDRLKLFLQVCSAVQFAHQRLIIHRDLKPGNILVTSKGTPKLLDFGIAKLFDPAGSTEIADATITMFRVLTPAYASPEQMKGEAITTASDVYSLGVLLYECLTGCRPYGQAVRTPHEVSRAVCEFEPEKPSTVIRRTAGQPPDTGSRDAARPSVSAVRDGTPEKLGKRLRGDLDNIVLMSLRKEPQRRYASVEQFAEDIRRHLHSLPVVARRDTLPYRSSKFVVRHKAGVAAAAIVAVVLLLGIVATLREARIAQRRFDDVRALANSLIFDVHDSIKDLPGSTPARKLIVERALQYLNALAAESGSDIGLQRELATGYERVGLVQGSYLQDNLGDTAGSLNSYEKALALRKQIGAKSRDWKDAFALAQAQRLVADLQWTMGMDGDARRNIERAVATSQALNAAHPNDFKILYELSFDDEVSREIGYPGDPNEDSKRRADAEKSLGFSEAALKIKPNDLLARHGYAVDLIYVGAGLEETDPRAALTYYERARDVEQSLARGSNAERYARQLAIAYLDVASVYDDLGAYSRAVENDQRYLAIYLRLSASDPKDVLLRQGLAIAYANTATALAKIGQTKSAIEDWNKGVEIMRDVVSLAPENVRQRHKLGEIIAAGGSILMRAHQPRMALRQFEQARDLYQSLGPKSDYDFANIADCTEEMGEAAALGADFQSATSYFRQALTVLEPLLSRHNTPVTALYGAADAYSGLGDVTLRKVQASRRNKGNWREARSWYAKSLDTWRRIPHPSHSGPNGVEVDNPAIVAKKLRKCEAVLSSIG